MTTLLKNRLIGLPLVFLAASDCSEAGCYACMAMTSGP